MRFDLINAFGGSYFVVEVNPRDDLFIGFVDRFPLVSRADALGGEGVNYMIGLEEIVKKFPDYVFDQIHIRSPKEGKRILTNQRLGDLIRAEDVKKIIHANRESQQGINGLDELSYVVSAVRDELVRQHCEYPLTYPKREWMPEVCFINNEKLRVAVKGGHLRDGQEGFEFDEYSMKDLSIDMPDWDNVLFPVLRYDINHVKNVKGKDRVEFLEKFYSD